MGRIKQLKGKIIFKHETEKDWEQSNYIPDSGEKVLYDPDERHNYTRTKYGDGETLVKDLPFSNIQGDFTQTDSTKADYIKNKPELGALSAKDEVVKTDLAVDVQASLDKADSAIQSIDGLATEDYVSNKIDSLGALANKSIVEKADLSENIQVSLNKADSAIQSLNGYATESFVSLKVAENDLQVSDDDNGNVTFNSGAPVDNFVLAELVQTTGDSETAVMSQKAVTKFIDDTTLLTEEAVVKVQNAVKRAEEAADLAVSYNGKGAYAYAKEGGYNGTEAEFAEDINPDNIKAEVTPVKGKDYFTEADKAEIAEMVDGATVVQAPKHVNSVDEMTDTERVYVMASTGKIWAYMDTSVEKEVTITDELDDTTYYDGCRLGSSATSVTDGITNDANGYHVTPLIDLTKEEYQGKTITIHLEGGHYVSQNVETWIQNRYYKTDGSVQYARGSSSPSGDMKDWKNAVINIESENSATITINMPLQMGSASVECGYLRFCGQGAVADSHIYITYQGTQTVTEYQWFDTGKSYSPAVSDEDMTIIAEQAAAIVDNNLLSVIGSGEVSV